MKDLNMDEPKVDGDKASKKVKKEKSQDPGLGSVFDEFSTYNGKQIGQDSGTRVSVSAAAKDTQNGPNTK